MLLASPQGEASQLLEKTKAGIWVPAEEPEALAGAVMKLEVDDKLRGEYAQNSLQAAQLYSRERQASEMLKAMKKIIH